MILYNRHHWLRAIWHFHTGKTAISLLKRLFFVGLYVTAVTITELTFYDIKLSYTPAEFFGAMGILLSLLLLFRTNTAYDRFYEGRRTWGALVNTTRNLAVLYHAILPKEAIEERLYFAKTISNFPFALKNHLRATRDFSELDEAVIGGIAELELRSHVPGGVVSQLRNRTEELYRKGTISDAQSINLNTLLILLLDINGICERIKSTPIPFSYNYFIKFFITAYLIVLPFTIIEEFGYLTVPIVLLVSYVLVGLEMIGEEIEEPFGLERNNLPLNQLSQMIRVNVHEIFGIYLPQVEKQAAIPDFLIVT